MTKRSGRPTRPLAPCGTDIAYKRHIRRREVPDWACMDAHAAALRAWRAKVRASRETGARYERPVGGGITKIAANEREA